MFLERLTQALAASKVDFALAGGYAVNLHGAVRGTVDIDLVLNLSEKNLAAAQNALSGLGLTSRIPVDADEIFRFREEYIKNRNLIAWSFSNPNNPIEMVDILLTHNLAKMKKQNMRVGSFSVPVLALQDLIDMKIQAGRPQDLLDVAALKKLK